MDDDIVLRGVVDPESLKKIRVASYQREVLSGKNQDELRDAILSGAVMPDIELGVRGARMREPGDNVFFLLDKTFVIDGLQRITAAVEAMIMNPDMFPRQGALIHFNTTEAWERKRFAILNTKRAKLSPNILIRNHRSDSKVVSQLINMTGTDKSFALYKRICWNQRMRRGDLLTAMTFVKVIGRLHIHLGPGGNSNVDAIVQGLDQIMEETGPNVFRQNIRTLFEIVDECWDVRHVQYRERASYLNFTFLKVLAQLFSRHPIFWDGKRLAVKAADRRKLKLFPITDPSIKDLTGSSGAGDRILYEIMVRHMNSGRRIRHLIPRDFKEPIDNGAEVDDENGGNGGDK